MAKRESFLPCPPPPQYLAVQRLTPIPEAGLGLASIIFLSGSIVLLMFVVLSAVKDTAPLNKTYFLRADTSGIPGARDGMTRWTYFYYCNDQNTDCRGPWPAPAFGWAWGQAADNVPSGLAGDHGGDTTSTEFYYLWRFGWVTYLIALFFTVIAWFGSFLACCGRLGSALAFIVSAAALFFLSIAVSLMTATFVKARNAFRAADRDAEIGTYAFGFSWGAWAALFIATLLFFIGIRGDKGHKGPSRFSRKRSVRSRRSFDVNSGHRVKEDYS
ncbi:Protein SUR7 [Colletotrichum gloeosporioides]|uniref:Protein SUR7 n=1 Tax=Colletotrichum gloeosporioides TaxID=474922 RepID=A0A8H4CJZ5_COLGL|nr:Protein SUR7 [Colletotrichum gloeosporioides]KAF3805378.1 Protein SUR7 [Colletotrichum gloeosporioides]